MVHLSTSCGFLKMLRRCLSTTVTSYQGTKREAVLCVNSIVPKWINPCSYFSYTLHIYRHLDCQPTVIDAKNFSPQLRRRLFWGNIPGLFTIHNEHQIEDGKSLTLDKSLMPNSGRRAAQAKIRTLTTNTNSLLQGRTENCSSRKDLAALFPVRCSFQQDENRNVETDHKKGKRGRGKQKLSDSLSDRHAVTFQFFVMWIRFFLIDSETIAGRWRC